MPATRSPAELDTNLSSEAAGWFAQPLERFQVLAVCYTQV